MKKLLRCIVSFVFVLCSVGNAQQGKVTVHVTDFDTSAAVSNALVGVSFDTNIKPGWGWGAGKPNRYSGATDTNGVCVLEGEGNGGTAGVYAKKEGYYGSSGYGIRFTNTTGVIQKKWQPWNSIIHVVIKRIEKPIPMYAKWMRDQKISTGETPVGFDLMEGDWVAPHGKGKQSDLLFKLERKPEQIVERIGVHRNYDVILYDITLTISGANRGDGFLSHPIPVRKGGSGLRMPRFAPNEGYEPHVSVRDYQDSIDKPFENTVDENMNYFFQVRTVLDKDGNVESALYGKIHGDFQLDHHGETGFTYYLNPTPNDRNLEFDPKQNLFKNIPSSEQVRQP